MSDTKCDKCYCKFVFVSFSMHSLADGLAVWLTASKFNWRKFSFFFCCCCCCFFEVSLWFSVFQLSFTALFHLLPFGIQSFVCDCCYKNTLKILMIVSTVSRPAQSHFGWNLFTFCLFLLLASCSVWKINCLEQWTFAISLIHYQFGEKLVNLFTE